MKKLILALLALGLTTQLYAQVVEDGQLPEITVNAVNYKYLNSVDNDDLDVNVKKLEREAATFDFRNSEVYKDEYTTYSITFLIPNGSIITAYNNDGKIVRTTEKYVDVKLPKSVSKSVAKEYFGWNITDDEYKVSYTRTKVLHKHIRFC